MKRINRFASQNTIGNKNILYVSYYFFPGWGVGSIRTIKFCKYLKRSGFDPVVFTTADRKKGKKDYSLADDVRGIEVIRTRSEEHTSELQSRM